MRKLSLLGFALVGLTSACKVSDEPFCDFDADCPEDKPFCDVNGDFAASDGFPNTCIATPEGFFHATWSFTSGDCASAGADMVSILTTDSAGNGVDDTFPCTAGEGTTFALLEGDYTVSVSLIDGASPPNVLAQFDAEEHTIVGGQTTELGNYEFEVTAVTGNITFDVDYGTAGNNCDSTVDGGAGVAQQETLLMDDTAGTCLMVELSGTDQTGTPFSADTCGEPVLCMDESVAQTLNGLPAGDYTLIVNGLKGATGAETAICYTGMTSFTVTGDADLGTIAVTFDDTDNPEVCNATKPAHRR